MSKTKSEILFIHQSGHIGGGQTYVDNLYGAIKQKGYQVKKTENQSKTQLIRTILNTSANTIIWVIYPSFSFFIFLLSVLLRKRNILIVLGVWLLEIQSTIRYRTLLRYNLRRFIKDKVMLWKQWLICIFANQIVHLSHYAQQLFLSTSILGTLKNKPQSIIGGGVNQRQFHPISPKQRITLRQQLGIPSDNLILLATGRLEPRKNYIDAIKLLAKLRRLMPRQSILLYFVFSYGEFNEYQYFDEIIKKSQELGMSKHIHYLSGISHSEIDKFYKSADIFLMLSKKIFIASKICQGYLRLVKASVLRA